MADTLNPVGPQTPSTPAPPLVSPQEMSSEQFDQFLKDGKVIEKPAEGTKAVDGEAAAPKLAEQAAEPAASTSPDPESGKPEKPTGKKPIEARNAELDTENRSLADKIRDNQTRLAERRRLREENARIERELAEADRPAARKDPASKTETPQQAYERFSKHADAPDPEKFTDLREFSAAMSMFVAEKVSEEKFNAMFESRTADAAARSEQERQEMAVLNGAEERAKAEEVRYPNWRDEIDPGLREIPPARALPAGVRPHFLNIIRDEALLESQNPIGLQRFMSTDEGKKWAFGLKDLPESAIRRAVMKMDLSLSDDQAADAEAANPATSMVSKAPAPSPTAGRKAAAPVDAEAKAIKENDFLAFDRIQNEKLLAKKR